MLDNEEIILSVLYVYRLLIPRVRGLILIVFKTWYVYLLQLFLMMMKKNKIRLEL